MSPAYSTMTVPAMVAMPQVMMPKISLRLIWLRYGRMNKGASTMPTKILAEMPRASAPPIPRVFSKNREIHRMITGKIFQKNSTEDRALMTKTKGRPWKARI